MQGLIRDVMAGLDLRAASFIVTVYGDVVVPRGGVLWTGSLIALCARVGINESLVRTAVSRLVAARQISGVRVGRRSYYRLDAQAEREFGRAARLLYAPVEAPRGWQILFAPDLEDEAIRRLRLGRMGGAVYIRPDRGQDIPPGALEFAAASPQDIGALAQFWDLDALNAGYRDMLARFRLLEQEVQGAGLPDDLALVARLLLVHLYRGVMLRDPRLPDAALPVDWQGHRARDLFRRLYLELTPLADRWTGAHCEGVAGLLPAETPETTRRIAGLLAARH